MSKFRLSAKYNWNNTFKELYSAQVKEQNAWHKNKSAHMKSVSAFEIAENIYDRQTKADNQAKLLLDSGYVIEFCPLGGFSMYKASSKKDADAMREQLANSNTILNA